MYLGHFGLHEHPFDLTPDTDYYYGNPSHQEAMNMMMVALRDDTGFIKVTGEVGTGKTLLCRKLVNELGTGFHVAYLPNPPLTPQELYLDVIRDLGLKEPVSTSLHEMLKLITDKLLRSAVEGNRVVIVLDEAQDIPDETMEALRLLTNLETEKTILLHVVLFGQPELDRRLAQESLRQLRQRIVFSDKLTPLDLDAVHGYLQHRATVGGYGGNGDFPLFSAQAVRLLYKRSGGIPRLINILAHKALMLAYGKGSERVKWSHVRGAILDTEGVSGRFAFGWPVFSLGILSLLSVVIIALLRSGGGG